MIDLSEIAGFREEYRDLLWKVDLVAKEKGSKNKKMHELNIILGENEYPLKIKEKIVEEGQPFLIKMDSDMNKVANEQILIENLHNFKSAK